LAREHQEAERLLAEQRALIAELELIRDIKHVATPGAVGSECTGDDDTQTHDADCGLVSAISVELPPASCSQLSTACDLPDKLIAHYREMLRAYVVMGAGNLADEMTRLATLLADAGVSAQRTMQLHVHVLEELIGSLGNRSARHVMTRADLLVLEVMAHLADGYRRRYDERCHPPRQLPLPGFDDYMASSSCARAA
jgi:hypothetical protein